MNNFDNDFENAIRFLSSNMPKAEDLEKPTLFHSLRVGVYLYQQGYGKDVCIAGLLHDLIEDSETTKEIISKEFGESIANLVDANTKKENIENKYEDLITRCIDAGEDALILKAADIIDNYYYYTKVSNDEGLSYVHMIGKLLLKQIPTDFSDKIFKELKLLLDK